MRSLIQEYASATVGGMVRRAAALRDLSHGLTKGEFREIFATTVLEAFLPSQFEIGCGVVVNQRGFQSRQMDIVIYDSRVVPPFIREQRLGVYPAESVLAAIEVKSRLTLAAIQKAASDALHLKSVVYDSNASIYPDFSQFVPLCGFLAFDGGGLPELDNETTGDAWIAANASSLDYLCLVEKWSWMRVQGSWRGKMGVPGSDSYDETKRFIAILLDNVRTRAEIRLEVMRSNHRDWLGAYIRDQQLFGHEES